MDEKLEGLRPEQVLPGVQLDLAGGVAQVEEGRLAVAAAGDQAAGDPVARLGLDPRRQALVGGADLADLLAVGELVRERVDPRFAQALQLSPALGEQVAGDCQRARVRSARSSRAEPTHPRDRARSPPGCARTTWNGAR